MTKRTRDCARNGKRAKISPELCQVDKPLDDQAIIQDSVVRVQQKDRIEKKVDLIIKDAADNQHRSLTVWGTGLGIEKTIAVVEELKRHFMKQGAILTQKTAIKASENNEAHLQVILTLPASIEATRKLEEIG